MNRLWQQLAIATNWPVLVAVAVLSAVGLQSIWARDPNLGMKQLVFLGVAFTCLAVVQAMNYTALGRFAWVFYGISLTLVMYTAVGSIVHVPGVNKVNGACAWIDLHFISIEPSELMKI